MLIKMTYRCLLIVLKAVQVANLFVKLLAVTRHLPPLAKEKRTPSAFTLPVLFILVLTLHDILSDLSIQKRCFIAPLLAVVPAFPTREQEMHTQMPFMWNGHVIYVTEVLQI